MNNLIIFKHGEAVCNSLQVAERFEKRHQEIIYAIEGRKCSCKGKGCKKCNGRGYQQLGILQEDLEINTKSHLSELFIKSSYKDAGGRIRPLYYMNRDGFALLAMGFTGKDALKWKLEYIRAFNAMEAIITEHQSPAWQQARTEGKKARRMETDAIKAFVIYAQEAGSKSADKYYIHYSKLADKAVGITDRDTASVDQLLNLRVIEMVIDRTVLAEIAAGTEYHQAFKNVRDKVQQVAALAFTPHMAIAG